MPMVQDAHASARRAPSESQQPHVLTAAEAYRALGSTGAAGADASCTMQILGFTKSNATPTRAAVPTKVGPTGLK